MFAKHLSFWSLLTGMILATAAYLPLVSRAGGVAVVVSCSPEAAVVRVKVTAEACSSGHSGVGSVGVLAEC